MDNSSALLNEPRKWNIAFLRRRFSPTGGAERYLLRLAAGLQGQGHQLTLFCEEWTPRESPFQKVRLINSKNPVAFAEMVSAQPLREQYDIVFGLERVPGLTIYRAGDGVHADWLAAREKASPVVGRLRSWMRPKNRQVCQLEARVFDPAHTKRIICNSRMVADQISQRFGFPTDRLDLVPNGVPFSQFRHGDRLLGRRALKLAADDYAVLLVGAGRERKGHDYARAMVGRCGVRNCKLVIIDRPPEVAMPHVYAAADVFLLPTLYDPFANVTLEALAAGLPVITTAQNGGSEILESEKNGFILPNAWAIRQGARWIKQLSDPVERRRFTEVAQKLAQEYDLSRNIRETLAVFDRC